MAVAVKSGAAFEAGGWTRGPMPSVAGMNGGVAPPSWEMTAIRSAQQLRRGEVLPINYTELLTFILLVG